MNWKNLTLVAGFLVAGLIGYGVAAYAQAGAAKDPVKADAKHYKVEFENEKVRILRITYAPGEKSVMHHHPDSVAVYLTEAKTRMTTPDGKSQDMNGKHGEATWTPAGDHLPQNIGAKPFEAILVEMKK